MRNVLRTAFPLPLPSAVTGHRQCPVSILQSWFSKGVLNSWAITSSLHSCHNGGTRHLLLTESRNNTHAQFNVSSFNQFHPTQHNHQLNNDTCKVPAGFPLEDLPFPIQVASLLACLPSCVGSRYTGLALFSSLHLCRFASSCSATKPG